MSQYTYANIPQVHFRRNRFKYNQQHLTTMSCGDLAPFFVQEVYPGETYKLHTKLLGRTSNTFLKSPVGNLVQDINYFFVPNRLVWEHWEEFLGANKQSSWANTQTYSIPQLIVPVNFWDDVKAGPNAHKHLYNRLYGAPIGSYESVSALPVRAFALIYNEWYRNQNVQAPVYVNVTDSDDVCRWGDFDVDNYTSLIPKVTKFKDRFTSALPAPQKGVAPAISFKLSADIPVGAGDDMHGYGGRPLEFSISSGDLFPSSSSTSLSLINPTSSLRPNGTLGYVNSSSDLSNYSYVTPANLYAYADDLDTGTSIDVNDLRMLFATQKLLERQARGGTRYKEILLNEWGVNSPDARLQIPEFLGGKRFPITYFQVPNTTSDKQASISSFGHYSDDGRMTKSFTEHGYIIGISSIRQIHVYQQGIERAFSRKTKLDFFNPVFSTIGEQPIYRREIYALDTVENNALAFGYAEAWSELRSRQNIVTGQMSSLSNNSLDVWTFADEYANSPILSSQFINETSVFVDRTLAVPSSTQDQFICQFVTHVNSIKELPVYSVPSLIDHY